MHTQVAAPVRAQGTDDVKKLFRAAHPEGGEGSRMEEVIQTIINNEVKISEDDDSVSLLHEAIKVKLYVMHRSL